MNDQQQDDPRYAPDPETSPHRLGYRVHELEIKAETYATREWVWKTAFAWLALLAAIIGLIVRYFPLTPAN